jgi:hypothetical protein
VYTEIGIFCVLCRLAASSHLPNIYQTDQTWEQYNNYLWIICLYHQTNTNTYTLFMSLIGHCYVFQLCDIRVVVWLTNGVKGETYIVTNYFLQFIYITQRS